MWHGLSGARFEEGVVCAGCDLSRGRRGIAGHGCEVWAGHGCEVWAGLGWSRAGSREWLWVEHG